MVFIDQAQGGTLLRLRTRSIAAFCAAAALGISLAGTASPATADAPTAACTGLYNARIVFFAMSCSEPGEPMIGGFATWRNVPIGFDQVDTSTETVQVANYMRVTPKTGDMLAADGIEVGLYAEKTGKTTQSYGPRWLEHAPGGGQVNTIQAGVNPNVADGRNHTYMTVRQEGTDQWSVLYDFNMVGVTLNQQPVPRGNSNRIDVGLEVFGPKYTNVPAIANRMQFMDENKTWRRVTRANTATSVTLPACSTTYKPPYCFSTKLTDSTSFTEWNVSKPRSSTTSAQFGPVATATSASSQTVPAVFNGVDQRALQTCMEEDPAGCLDTVPGLAECVMTQDACNAEALLASDAPATQRRSEPAASAAQIRSQAAKAFGVAKSDLSVTAPPVAAVSFDAADREVAWTVSSTHMTAGLRPSGGREYEGFQASYSPRGDLLKACWGDLCP
ncbi:hypothetical protein ACIQUX_35280 [Streptomyces sp. NPDC101133]|uniref:hypothetical protein n=1 Tax=Streptomyces sp. NPDC101133 TaxID=3366111 RepID=UPI003802F82B